MGKEEDNSGNEEGMLGIFCHTYWCSWGTSGSSISSWTNNTLKTKAENKTFESTAPHLETHITSQNSSLIKQIWLLIIKYSASV